MRGTSGAAITAGQSVYVSAVDGSINPAKSDTTAHAKACGVALNSAPGAGQPIDYMPNGGTVNLGSGTGMVAGQSYYVSANSGGIAPVSDLTTGNIVTFLGVAISTTLLPLNIVTSGIAHA